MNATEPDQRLIFLHMPKTAGLTTRNMLRAHYKPSEAYVPAVSYARDSPFLRYVRHETDDPPTGTDGNVPQLARFRALDAQRQARMRLFMGHFWYGVHELLPAPSIYITIIRDPIERALSLYAHRVRQHEVELSLTQYLQAARDFEMLNSQTRRLACTGLRHGEPVTQTMLDVAKERLATLAVTGTTERFDEFVVVLARTMGWAHMDHAWDNRGVGRPSQDDVDANLLADLEDRNRFDRDLHQFAGALLDQRVVGLDLEAELRRLGQFRRARKIAAGARKSIQRAKRAGARVVAAGRSA